MWFDLDINKYAVEQLPFAFRQSKQIAWIKSLLYPLILLLDDFKKYRIAVEYNLKHNSQVCYLRAMLNDFYDPILRRIQIVDGLAHSSFYIYTKAEAKLKFLPKFIRLKEELEGSTDFKVLVPTELVFNEYEFKAKIDYYKLVSKKYTIQKI